MKNIEIWTDGSCNPNPGNGSWAFVILEGDAIVTEASGFIQGVTNNRMEYQALIEAFKFIDEQRILPEKITVCSDSDLLVQTLNSWMAKWKSNGWRRSKQSNRGTKFMPVANLDLVKQLDAIKQRYVFKIKWVKGHSNLKWNEHCDQLCRMEFNKRGLKSFEQLREEGKIFR